MQQCLVPHVQSDTGKATPTILIVCFHFLLQANRRDSHAAPPKPAHLSPFDLCFLSLSSHVLINAVCVHRLMSFAAFAVSMCVMQSIIKDNFQVKYLLYGNPNVFFTCSACLSSSKNKLVALLDLQLLPISFVYHPLVKAHKVTI